MGIYIERTLTPQIVKAVKYYPVLLISGARQVGKSTLCRHIFPDYKYVNLEDNVTFLKASSEPSSFLKSLGEKAIIDEIQKCETLFSQIQYEVDNNKALRYILTGSSDFNLMKNASQSMAGRVAIFTLPPLTFEELSKSLKDISTEELFYRGFYPGVIAGEKPVDFFYKNYYSTYIEKDIRRQLKIENLSKFDIFMRLIASRVGSEFNASSLAGEVGVSSKTISEWVSILEGSFILYPLRPYYTNISKRLSKMPKYYFYDTGIVTYLLGIETPAQLISHPLRGALFENMCVSEMINRRINQARNSNFNFYRERNGKEVDLLQINADGIAAYEVKSATSFHPEFLRNLEYLRKTLPDVLSTLVIYDGDTFLPIAENIRNL